MLLRLKDSEEGKKRWKKVILRYSRKQKSEQKKKSERKRKKINNFCTSSDNTKTDGDHTCTCMCSAKTLKILKIISLNRHTSRCIKIHHRTSFEGVGVDDILAAHCTISRSEKFFRV